MHPILFTLGPVTLYTYGVMLVVAFLTSTWLAVRAARRLPPQLIAVTPEQLVDFACLVLLGGIVGGRLLYVILSWEFFRRAPQEIPAIWHGGLVWYGGFLGGVFAGWLYIRSKRLVFLRVLDQFIPFLALGHALGRLGCFLNGCCYGKPTDAWCGVTFVGQSERVLPTQLFEAAGLVLLFGLLRRLQQPRYLGRPGWLFGLYLGSYAVLRFFVEFLRGDQPIWWRGLTLPQLMSLVMWLAGCALLVRAMQKGDGAHLPVRRRAGRIRTAS